jgi:protein TonB
MESGTNAGSGDGSTRAAGNVADFQQQLFFHIQRFQIYPLQARQDRLQGRVIIVFVMSRAGAVLDARVQASSGYPILDQAAIDTIARAQPLPEIPAEMNDPLEVEIPIEFSLPR